MKKILELKPVCVTYEVERPYRVFCRIVDKDGNIGKGLAICSVIDEFDEKEGKNKAAGRAVKALVNREDSDPIRKEWTLFSDSWTKGRIWRVIMHSMFKHKSIYDEEYKMGTRADFYIQENDKLEWLGSIAWDGYDIGEVANAKYKDDYRSLLNDFLSGREDATFPDMGWPWPWLNSKLTDEIYIFIPNNKNEEGEIWKKFGGYDYGDHKNHLSPLEFIPMNDEQEYDEDQDEWKEPKRSQKICVPDMSHLKNITFGPRSGLTIFRV